MKRLLTISLMVCVWAAVFAQQPTLRNFSSIEYNGGTQNWGISQSDDQSMLFANNNGLLTFDSDKWTVSMMPNYTNVRSVTYDAKTKRIYVGATDEYGYFTGDSTTYELKYTSLSATLPDKERSFGEVWKIHPLDKDLVFRCRSKFFVYHKNQHTDVYDVKEDIENSAVANGTLYISCKNAIYRFTGQRLETLPGCEVMRGKSVRAVLSYGKSLLFVTASDGIWTYDQQTFSPYTLDISPLLIQNQVYCADIHGNYIAFGTVRNGLIVKDLKTNDNHYVNVLTGMQNNTVLSLRFDDYNNIWLGLDNGISYLMLDTPYRDLLGAGCNIGTGYASQVYNSSIYLGTNQGLFVTPWPLPKTATPPTPQIVSGVSGQIWCVKDINGTLLCGANEGAFVVRGTTAQRIDGLTGTWNFIPLKQHPGYVLTSDYDGLAILKASGDGYRLENRVEGFGESSGGFEIDNDGSIWLSHWQKGIYHFSLTPDLKRAVDIEYFNHANALAIDDNNLVCKINGKIYISSVDGFRNYDPKKHTLVKNEPFNRIFDTYDTALRIFETPQHDIWGYKPGYLAIARHQKNGTYKTDTVAYNNMTRRLQLSLGHFSQPDSNHIILNYDNGFYVMNNHFEQQQVSSNVYVRAIYSTSSNDSLLYFHYPSASLPEIVVPHSLNSLRIEFVMPEYHDQNAVDYSYKLENYDKQFSAPSPKTTKEYTQLDGGRYIFRVKAHNHVNGKVSEATICIKVKPAWYDTWYAYILYIMCICAAIYALYRYINYRARRELQRVKREKERELREQQMQFNIQEEKREKELIKLRSQKLEVDLKQKSSELGDSTMNLVRKNDMLQEIDKQLEDLSESVRREDAKAKITKAISDIRRGIRNNMSDDDNWEKFSENFNLVYDNFMQKITAVYPDLKRNDLKLCAYLRMGLSSKEMASLLNTSVRSVETARYRLRKKLNMDSGENLLNFIQKFEDKEDK